MYCCRVSGHCSHVIGLIKSLQGLKLHNFTTVPDQLSCTSIPQQWHVPRGSKIKAIPLNHVVVARPTESRKRKPVVCQTDINKRYEFKIQRICLNRIKSACRSSIELYYFNFIHHADTTYLNWYITEKYACKIYNTMSSYWKSNKVYLKNMYNSYRCLK